jgi:sugar phosphate isomerase/epimerase
MTGSALALNSLDSMATSTNIKSQPGYQLLVMGTGWGYAGSTEEFCLKLKGYGYDGAEFWFPQEEKERDQILSTFKKHNLKYGFLVGGNNADYKKHFEQFTSALNGAVKFNPVYINCHSGRDHFSFEQNKTFIDATTKAAKDSGVSIYHETHRSRILFAAPVARQFIEKLPDLRITLDISHWCNVHETYLDDQAETLAMTFDRVGHIHARIGHPEGPQVNDPRAPEWKHAVEKHFEWWDKIVNKKKQEGKLMTFLTEFGPIDYMPSLPYTRQPLADQWEINVHMLNTLRARYA